MAFLMITPAFGVAAGVVLLGEPLTIHLGVGLAVVILGLWLVNRPSRKPAKA
jgi:drug/metabolite transporter (DMT)-like permease